MKTVYLKKQKIRLLFLLYISFCMIVPSNTNAQITKEDGNVNKVIKLSIEHYYIVYEEDGIVKKSKRHKGFYDENKLVKYYNKKGILTEIIRLKNNDTVKRVSFIFKEDTLKEKRNYKKGNKLLTTINYIYDTKGKLYLEETYSDKRKVLIDTLKYNQHGIQLFKIISNAEGKLLMTKGYEFDSSGKIIEFSSFNYRTDDFTRITYKYNLYNNMIVKVTEKNNYLTEKSSFKYDNFGNITEKTKHDYSSNLIYKKTFKYEFDNKNNWIKETVFKDHIPQYIIEREIEYY